MATSSQRVYRAACPNCGAPVEFASAASVSAVCSFCRSTLVRDGDTLRRIGVSAELFDDHSPLQLGAGGTRQGIGFTLVGRLQYAYEGGTWNEWHALFDNGRSAWLSEDNGAYVFAFDAPVPADAPALQLLKAGQRVTADGRAWDVASVVQARLLAAEGELPRPPQLEAEFTVADLRNPAGEVATLDGLDRDRPGWSVGRSVALSELAMQGLKDGSAEKTLSAKGAPCPNCGAALDIQLASTKTVTCTQCNAVVDVSAGVGAELQHYQQNNAGVQNLEPGIPLGATGTLALDAGPLPWQVVGWMERCTVPQGGGDEDGDETFFWREYLLYHRTAGFAFLVDSDEGWSWTKPITGAPSTRGSQATWQGTSYTRKEAPYSAKVTWVQGEFYWRVKREERALVTDYASGKKTLSREQTGNEVTWSAGQTLEAATVAMAFSLDPKGFKRDVAPVSFKGGGFKKILWALVFVFMMVSFLYECSNNERYGECYEVRNSFGESSAEFQQCMNNRSSGSYRSGSSGGSYGGWSSGGGGHK